jgi:enhancer of polycomb-like protein
MRLDRRNSIFAHHRGKQPTSSSEYADWLFPDTFADKPYSKRPKSIDDVDADANSDDNESSQQSKRRRLDEVRRYDVDSGGAVGVGMGISRDDDRIIIDDLDPK